MFCFIAPVAHWELTKANGNFIKGDPGVRLRMSEGVRIHDGHAILDGERGYLDAGDYQGECFSGEHQFVCFLHEFYKNLAYKKEVSRFKSSVKNFVHIS